MGRVEVRTEQDAERRADVAGAPIVRVVRAEVQIAVHLIECTDQVTLLRDEALQPGRLV